MIKRIIIALVLLTNVLSGISQDTIIDKKINPKWVEPEVVFDQPLKEQKAQEPDKEEGGGYALPSFSFDNIAKIDQTLLCVFNCVGWILKSFHYLIIER